MHEPTSTRRLLRVAASFVTALSAGILLVASSATAEGSVVAAGEAAFASAASFRGASVTGLDLGAGIAIDEGGAATGTLQLAIHTSSGAEIAVTATAGSGVVNDDGSATVAGEAFIDAGSRLPAVGPVPFQATLAPEGIALEIGDEPLPVALLSAGGISVEDRR